MLIITLMSHPHLLNVQTSNISSLMRKLIFRIKLLNFSKFIKKNSSRATKSLLLVSNSLLSIFFYGFFAQFKGIISKLLVAMFNRLKKIAHLFSFMHSILFVIDQIFYHDQHFRFKGKQTKERNENSVFYNPIAHTFIISIPSS